MRGRLLRMVIAFAVVVVIVQIAMRLPPRAPESVILPARA